MIDYTKYSITFDGPSTFTALNLHGERQPDIFNYYNYFTFSFSTLCNNRFPSFSRLTSTRSLQYDHETTVNCPAVRETTETSLQNSEL